MCDYFLIAVTRFVFESSVAQLSFTLNLNLLLKILIKCRRYEFEPKFSAKTPDSQCFIPYAADVSHNVPMHLVYPMVW